MDPASMPRGRLVLIAFLAGLAVGWLLSGGVYRSAGSGKVYNVWTGPVDR